MPISQPFTLRKISETTVDQYIKCHVEDDLSQLIISGKPTEQELTAHYNDIVIEYHDIIGSSETKTMLMMQKKAAKLRSKIRQVVLITNAYLFRRNKELKELLSKYGFRFESFKSDKQVLKLMEAYVKSWQVELSNAEQDINNYLKKKKSVDKVTRKTFLENIVALKKEGYDVHLHTMLDEYAVAINSYNQLMEAKQTAA